MFACDPCEYAADFNYEKVDNSATNITIGDQVTFLPDEKLAMNYSWDFGQGSFSNQMNPKHTFWSAGRHIVTLTLLLENSDCSNATSNKTVVIETLEGTTSSFMMTGKNVNFYLIGKGEETEAEVAELDVEPFDAIIDTFETIGKTNAEKVYLYYTDNEARKVYRYSFEDRMSEIIHNSILKPEYIITDHNNNYIYWTAYDNSGEFPNTYIYRSNLDGTESVKYWVSGTEATGLEINVASGLLYFSDLYSIRSIPLSYFNGVDVTFDYVMAAANGGVTAIHFDEEKNRIFYVEDFGEHFISYINLASGEINYVGQSYNPLPVEAIAVNNNENKVYWINQSAQTVEWGVLGTFETYETDWILEVTNPRILELAEH